MEIRILLSFKNMCILALKSCAYQYLKKKKIKKLSDPQWFPPRELKSGEVKSWIKFTNLNPLDRILSF